MDLKQLHFCFVGNMLGRSANNITSQGQILADLFSNEGYQITCVSSKKNKVFRLAEILITLVLGRRTFDVILLEVYSGLNFVVTIAVAQLCMLFSLPLIMVLHGGNLPEFSNRHPFWTRFALTKADALVAPSFFLAEKIGQWGYEITVIPNVLDIDLYPFRERSAISPKLIWMRSFHTVYNPEMAIQVLKKLCDKGLDTSLIMAGKDKGLESKIRQMARDLDLFDRIRFVGFLNSQDKISEFAQADIYINTNRIDNMPVAILEARALGLPVVSTDVGGLPYLIRHKVNGLLGKDEDIDSMVENIELLLVAPELTRKISKKGRILAEMSAWPRVRDAWEKLILRLAKENLENIPRLLNDNETASNGANE